MSIIEGWAERDIRALTPQTKHVDETESQEQMFLDVVGESRGSGDETVIHFNENAARTSTEASLKLDIDESLTPLHALNPVQHATITILKAGLDQISWEPLIGLLEDLAACGTVSRLKLHKCSKDVISRILGSDLEKQVLQQFHEEPNKGEVIMIESLIFSYVQELSNKMKLPTVKNQTGKSSMAPANQRKKKPFSKEKRAPPPSYQKTTESFRRKQRGKRQHSPPRYSHKRPARQTNRHDNKIQPTQERASSKNKGKFSTTTQKIPSLPGYKDLIPESGDQRFDMLIQNETLEIGSHIHHPTPAGDTVTRNNYTKKQNPQRRNKRLIDEQDWDQFEAETAIKTYEAVNSNIRKKFELERITQSTISNPIKTLEFTPSKSAFENNNTVNNPYFDFKREAKTKDSTSILKKPSKWDTAEVCKPEKDVQSCRYLHQGEKKETCAVELNKPIQEYGYVNVCHSFPLEGSNSLMIRAGQECNKFYTGNEIVGTRSLTDTIQVQADIVKVKAEKECSTVCHKTTETDQIQDDPVRNQCVQFPSSNLAPALYVENRQHGNNPSCENLIALRISEKLMGILKEQFTIRKRFDEHSLDYKQPVERESVHLPYSELEKIRSDNGMIMKRLNVISALTVMVLISSILTSAIFLFVPENNFVQKQTVDFIQRLLYGWCR